MAAPIVYSLCHAATELGLPEARIPLAEAAVLLATSPKSNSAYLALDAAMQDIKDGHVYPPPKHIQSPLYDGYKYPHDYEGHYVEQQYLPDRLKNKKYYTYGDNKHEQAAKAYFDSIKLHKK
jgi:putative ATPase